MYDENQTFVPESFAALYQDGRQRLTLPKAELARRSEFCEDLAQLMTEHCSTVHFRDGVDTGQCSSARCAGCWRRRPASARPRRTG